MGGEAVNKSIKGIFSLKIKPRQDGYSDQICRILMCKLMLLGALMTGLTWYEDKIQCIIPKYGDKDPVMDKGFVSSACWINGLYIFEDIRYHKNSLGYYGIPNDINLDGLFEDGKTCSTSNYPDCKPMKKLFFLQYQYMTFLFLGLAFLFYSPYYSFLKVNSDINQLKSTIKDESAETIISTYFNTRLNPKSKTTLRVFGTIFVKVLYIVVSVTAFVILDNVLNGGYGSYGLNWLTWSKLTNTIAYDYMGRRLFPKPGNVLLPSYGFCEVYEAAEDIKTRLTNKHKFVCEMSQHILFQYILIILWFAMIATIVVAVIGLLALIIDYVLTLAALGKDSRARSMSKHLSLREFQYLELMRRKNMTVYGDVIRLLEETVLSGVKSDSKFD